MHSEAASGIFGLSLPPGSMEGTEMDPIPLPFTADEMSAFLTWMNHM